MLISISGLILGFAVVPEYNVPAIIQILLNKVYLIALLFWINILTLYTLFVSKKDKRNFDKTIKLFKYFDIINIIMALVLPMELTIQESGAVPMGLALMYAYSVFSIEFIFQLICVFRNYKDLKNKKYVPLYILSTLGMAVMANQIINPEMNYLVNPMFLFITIVMYHTIENPDIKLLSEVYKNKELVEQTYEDKSNFLFELSGEVREPLLTINNLCNTVKDEKDIKKIKEVLKEITTTARQLDFIVNDVINVSNLSVQKIKFVDNRYNINNLYNELVTKISSCKSENVEFRTSISHNIPYLYGDSLKLKQIILSILLNAVKKTEKGFIEFRINTIERYDVCRLMITIKDSGSGISIDKINEILAATGELNSDEIKDMEKMDINMKLCQKVVKLMGGSLMIKSQVGKGTEVILVVDQRIHVSNNENNNNYQNYSNSNKCVLLVAQNKEIVNNIKKKYQDRNINLSHVLYGMDAVDKIKSGKRYDYILVEDDMKEMNGYTTLKELNKLDKFNTPIVIMLNKNKYNIKEHYLNDGFKDYIMLEKLSDEINRIIDKY